MTNYNYCRDDIARIKHQPKYSKDKFFVVQNFDSLSEAYPEYCYQWLYDTKEEAFEVVAEYKKEDKETAEKENNKYHLLHEYTVCSEWFYYDGRYESNDDDYRDMLVSAVSDMVGNETEAEMLVTDAIGY